MDRIYHIALESCFKRAAKIGAYLPMDFDTDGFVHCSYAHQLSTVAASRSWSAADLVLLEIDREKIPSRVIDENPQGGTEPFPHIYGPVPVAAVMRVRALKRGPAGELLIPSDLSSPDAP